MKNVNWLTLVMGLWFAATGGTLVHKATHPTEKHDTAFAITMLLPIGAAAIHTTRRALRGEKL